MQHYFLNLFKRRNGSTTSSKRWKVRQLWKACPLTYTADCWFNIGTSNAITGMFFFIFLGGREGFVGSVRRLTPMVTDRIVLVSDSSTDRPTERQYFLIFITIIFFIFLEGKCSFGDGISLPLTVFLPSKRFVLFNFNYKRTGFVTHDFKLC